MRCIYIVWSNIDGGEIIGFMSGEDWLRINNGELIWDCVFLVWCVEVGSYEEVMVIYNIWCGFGFYKLLGELVLCLECGVFYYFEGSV